MLEILIISVAGGILCLDRVFIQAMVSRPVVIAPFIGLGLGNVYVGLVIGAFIELVWIDRIPIGTYIPPNDSIAAVLATSIAILAGQKVGGVYPQLISLSILIGLPAGIAAKYLDIFIIKSNESMSDRALEEAKRNEIRRIERKVFWGLGKTFIFYAVFLMTSLAILLPAVTWLYPILPRTAMTTLLFANYFLPLLGIAVAINTFKLRGAIPVFCAVFLIVAAVMEFFHVR